MNKKVMGCTKLPTIKMVDTNVLNEKEYILRDLMGMCPVYITDLNHVYIARGRNKRMLIVAIICDGGNDTVIYMLNNLDTDAQDDFITILKQEGAGYTWESWLSDYDTQVYSFWEYVQEHQN